MFAVEALQLVLVLAAIAAIGIVAAMVMRAIDKRERRALDAQVLALWEALALARQDLRLEVNERGERFLHGTVRGVRYTLSLLSPGRGWAGTLGATARVARNPAPRLVLWPSNELPPWAPRLPRTVKTGHDEFDQVFTLHTDDEPLALTVVDASVREALLGIPGAALVCDEGKLTLVTSLDERQVDAELVDHVRAVVAGLCASPEVEASDV
jgi:hypothetical protein